MYRIFILTLVICATSVQSVFLSKTTDFIHDVVKPKLDFFGYIYSIATDKSVTNEDPLQRGDVITFLKDTVTYKMEVKNITCDESLENTCGKYFFRWNRPTEESSVHRPLIQQLSEIQNAVKDLLNKPVNKQESKSLSVEKQLYQDCMTTEIKSFAVSSQNLVDFAFKNIIPNASLKSWQIIDKELMSLGFGNTFFELSINSDPCNNDKKFLLLTPPSSIKLVNEYKKLTEVIDILKLNSTQEIEFEVAMHFFNSLEESISKKYESPSMNVDDWLSLYERKTGGKDMDPFKFRWTEMFQQYLSEVSDTDINVSTIIVKDKEYFYNLVQLLKLYSNENITPVTLLTVKWIFNNLNYVNWNAWNAIHNQDKSTYCMRETALYGASYVHNSFVKETKEVLSGITRNIIVDIKTSSHLTEKEKCSLFFYLFAITSNHITDNNKNISSTIDYVYGDLQLTHNHLTDMINYRKLVDRVIKQKKFNNGSAILPFSINHLNEPQNRLILTTIFRMSKFPSLYKSGREFYYGYHGTQMARFLYDLIINKLLHTEENYNSDIEWLMTHPVNYPSEMKKCLTIETSANSSDIIMSEVLALKVSYEAMLYNYQDYGISRKDFTVDNVKYKSDELFILSYINTHCYWYNDLAADVLRNFPLFKDTYCPSKQYWQMCDVAL